MINYSEVSLNDWVWMLDVNAPVQIDYIDPIMIGADYGTDDYYIPNVKFKPCDITDKFLELNGWEYDELGYLWRHKDFPYLYGHTKDFSCEGLEIKYVHQLQHILRIKGFINEANNLKYE